jgi:hypothetical protein
VQSGNGIECDQIVGQEESMTRFWSRLGLGLAILAVVLVAAISLTVGWRPFLGPRARQLTDRKFEPTPERLARGRYLATSVSGCMYCHSEHDWKSPGAPVVEAKLGAGEIFPVAGMPGTVVAPNLTPDSGTGAGTWSDDQLARAYAKASATTAELCFLSCPTSTFEPCQMKTSLQS